MAQDIVDRLPDHERLLVALDAPLGWPKAMRLQLKLHRAGMPMPIPANRLFRRRTDDVVYETLGKRPLDVGADRIARTAVAALEMLEELRVVLGAPIPLGWTSGELVASDDVLDAVVCCLAGWDYLHGAVIPAEDRELAEREGWIWVRSTSRR